MIERARARNFGSMQAQHIVLRLAQQAPPFGVGFFKLYPFGWRPAGVIEPAHTRRHPDSANAAQKRPAIEHCHRHIVSPLVAVSCRLFGCRERETWDVLGEISGVPRSTSL